MPAKSPSTNAPLENASNSETPAGRNKTGQNLYRPRTEIASNAVRTDSGQTRFILTNRNGQKEMAVPSLMPPTSTNTEGTPEPAKSPKRFQTNVRGIALGHPPENRRTTDQTTTNFL